MLKPSQVFEGVFVISCDSCDTVDVFAGSSHAEAWAAAQRAGWSVRKGDPKRIHCCPAGHARRDQAEVA